MGGTGGKAPKPSDEIPGNGADECRGNEANGESSHLNVEGRDIYNSLPDRLSYSRAEDEWPDKFTDCSHQKGFSWRERPRGNDGGHYISRIVKPVGKIEEERQGNNDDSE